jgi:hypothetical protein
VFVDRERIRAAREKLRTQKLRLHELMTNASEGTSDPGEDLMAAMVDFRELQNELEFLQDDSPDFAEPDAFVGAPVKRPPHRNSGAIALPEPEE